MSQFGQKSAKVFHCHIVQQSNCRWHCEPTFSLGWAFYNDKSLHTLPLQFLHLLTLLLQSLPLQTLRLIFFVSLIILNIKNTVPECILSAGIIFSGALYLAVHYISNLHANLNRPVK